jgi:hypothetical protein
MAMTWQLLSRLAHSASAALTAACSFAAFNPSPGRPIAPTATAFQPFEAYHRIAGSLEEAGYLERGRNRDDKIIVERDDHAGDAGDSAARFEGTPHRFLDRVQRYGKEKRAAGAQRERLVLSRRCIDRFKPRLAAVAGERNALAAKGCSVTASCLIHGSGGIGGLPGA